MTPEPQYATSSPSGSSGSGAFHGALSAPGIRPGTRSTAFGSPRQRSGNRASTTTSSLEAGGQRLAPDRVAAALGRLEGRRCDLLLAAAERAAPLGEVDHGAVVVAEMPEQPPEPLGAAERAVGDHEHAGLDPTPGRRRRELLGARERVAAARPGGRREVALDVDERRAGDVGSR